MEVTSFNIENQYKAFLAAQELLKKECRLFVNALDNEMREAKRISIIAEHLLPKQDPLHKWVKGAVIPSLNKVKTRTEAMQRSIAGLPRLPIK